MKLFGYGLLFVFYPSTLFSFHLFASCSNINDLLNWIARYNKFIFERSKLEDLWNIYACIP
jgi:hypothetical protein